MGQTEAQGIDVRHPDEFRVVVRLRGPSGAARDLELSRWNLMMMVDGVWPRELAREAGRVGLPDTEWVVDAAKAARDGVAGFYEPPRS